MFMFVGTVSYQIAHVCVVCRDAFADVIALVAFAAKLLGHLIVAVFTTAFFDFTFGFACLLVILFVSPACLPVHVSFCPKRVALRLFLPGLASLLLAPEPSTSSAC